ENAHLSGSVLARRDRVLEVEVLERGRLGRDREATLPGNRRKTARHRPGKQHPVPLEAKVVVQSGPSGGVLLNDEPVPLPGRAARRRLWRLREVALAPVLIERVLYADRFERGTNVHRLVDESREQVADLRQALV